MTRFLLVAISLVERFPCVMGRAVARLSRDIGRLPRHGMTAETRAPMDVPESAFVGAQGWKLPALTHTPQRCDHVRAFESRVTTCTVTIRRRPRHSSRPYAGGSALVIALVPLVGGPRSFVQQSASRLLPRTLTSCFVPPEFCPPVSFPGLFLHTTNAFASHLPPVRHKTVDGCVRVHSSPAFVVWPLISRLFRDKAPSSLAATVV